MNTTAATIEALLKHNKPEDAMNVAAQALESYRRQEASAPTFRNSQDAFADAIDQGELSNDPQADNFAGNFMYMHSDQPIGTDSFKHRMTRRYLHVQRPAVPTGLFAAAKR